MGTAADGSRVSAAPIVARRLDRSNAATLIFFAAVAAALIIASFLRAPLSWDGSFYLFEMLDRQTWFIAQPHRWINYALQAPTLVAMHLTWNLKILTLIFSLSYASVPMIGLTSSWLVCRKRPALFVWPAIGIGLVSLPGVFCFNSEATMTAALFWPVLLASLVGVSLIEFLLAALLAMSMLIVHPDAVSVLGLGALTAFVSAIIPPFKPMRLAGAVALAMLTVGRLLIPLTPYEHRQVAVFSLSKALVWGLEGWPLASLICTFLAAALLLRRGLSRKPPTAVSEATPIVAIVAAELMLLPWAIQPSAWANEMEYRFWVAPLSLVIMGACALDAWATTMGESTWHQRQRALIAVGAVFLVVLSLQSFIWYRLTNRLISDLAREGCTPMTSLPWIRATPLNHWSTASYAIILQSRTPHTLLLDGDGCREYAADKVVNIIWLRRHDGDGWFDLGQVPVSSQSPRER
jgi:hypothetical protein